jgi:hypothetical protein
MIHFKKGDSMNLFRIVLGNFLALTFLVSCSSTTMIRTTDSQAKIYVDGELKGTGTASHTDTKTVGASTSVRIEKQGCEPAFYTFSRNEEFDVGACVGGALVLVPFLWIQKYKPERTFEYTCTAKK